MARPAGEIRVRGTVDGLTFDRSGTKTRYHQIYLFAMKILLTSLIAFWSTVLFGQDDYLKNYFVLRTNNESTYRQCMSVLDRFDPNDRFKSWSCETAAESVGDYYSAKKDYQSAIAYYDSANTKYQNRATFCGNVYFSSLIRRRFKTSVCYSALGFPERAIETLTPYVFGDFGSRYRDSLMIAFYVQTLHKLYTPCEIQRYIQQAIDAMHYQIKEHPAFDRKEKIFSVSSSIHLFGTDIILADQSTSRPAETLPDDLTRNYLINEFKSREIFKVLMITNRL